MPVPVKEVSACSVRVFSRRESGEEVRKEQIEAEGDTADPRGRHQ
jgi:hypothetical protein